MHHSRSHFINNIGFEWSLWSWDACNYSHEFTRNSFLMFLCSPEVWVQWFPLGVFGLSSFTWLELLLFSPVFGPFVSGLLRFSRVVFWLGYSSSCFASFSLFCLLHVFFLIEFLWWFLLCSIKFLFNSLVEFAS